MSGVDGFDFELTFLKWQWVAEGDPIGCFLGCHSPCDDGGLKDWTLLGSNITILHVLHDFFAQCDDRFSGGFAACGIFNRHVNHSWLVLWIDVSEWVHGWIVEVARLEAKVFLDDW